MMCKDLQYADGQVDCWSHTSKTLSTMSWQHHGDWCPCFLSREHKTCIWCWHRITTLSKNIQKHRRMRLSTINTSQTRAKCGMSPSSSNCVITINNASNAPTILCNSLRNLVILKLPLLDNTTLTFLCEFLRCWKPWSEHIGIDCCCRQDAAWGSFYLGVLVDNGSWTIKWMLRQNRSSCSFPLLLPSCQSWWTNKKTNMALWAKANEGFQWLNMFLDECLDPFSSTFVCVLENIGRAEVCCEQCFGYLLLIMSLARWLYPAIVPSLDLIFDCL